MKVMVVGGGIGGLTTALCCAEAGMDVQIFEQASKISEVGAGIQISPNGTRILQHLGLDKDLKKHSFHPHSLDMRIGKTGKTVFSIPILEAQKKYGAPYYHIHRSDLLSVLLKAVQNRADCKVFLNHKLTSVHDDELGVGLNFETGENYVGDIVIGADGIHSVVRDSILEKDNARFTGNVAWRAVIPSSDELKEIIPPCATVWTGNRRHAVTYYLRNGDLINFVGIVEQDDWIEESWSLVGDISELRREFDGFCHPVQVVLENVKTCFKWALHDREPLNRWSNGRKVVLGDAAHPMLPFLAQGAVMAIEDAQTLALCLVENPLQEALIKFEKQRKPRTIKVQSAARSNMKLFHHGTTFSQLMHYGPIMLAAAIVPQFIQSRQDWLYGYGAENPN